MIPSVRTVAVNLKIASAVTLPDAWFAILTFKLSLLQSKALLIMLSVYHVKMDFA